MLRRIAALYVDPVSAYSRMALVECWDLKRDARLYEGPHPVVAHPPCGPWGKQRHNYRGSERPLFRDALEQVRAFGGVLEHPEHSTAWEAFDLPLPGDPADEYGGYTLAVSQCEWGHPARKRTWLYLVGVPRSALTPPPFPGREPTHWCSGGRNHTTRTNVPPGIKVCSAQQRRRTPPAFAEWLVSLARTVPAPTALPAPTAATATGRS